MNDSETVIEPRVKARRLLSRVHRLLFSEVADEVLLEGSSSSRYCLERELNGNQRGRKLKVSVREGKVKGESSTDLAVVIDSDSIH